MSHAVEVQGRVCGLALIGFSAIVEWLTEHGLSTAVIWIAIIGLALNCLTSLPALERSFHTFMQIIGKEKK